MEPDDIRTLLPVLELIPLIFGAIATILVVVVAGFPRRRPLEELVGEAERRRGITNRLRLRPADTQPKQSILVLKHFLLHTSAGWHFRKR
jgi:hypothetical protein